MSTKPPDGPGGFLVRDDPFPRASAFDEIYERGRAHTLTMRVTHGGSEEGQIERGETWRYARRSEGFASGEACAWRYAYLALSFTRSKPRQLPKRSDIADVTSWAADS